MEKFIIRIGAKPKLLLCLLAIAMFSTASGAAPIVLGTSSSFGILAGSTITNTGDTSIDGDIGIWPSNASSITGFPPGSYTGSLHAGDGVAQQAQSDAAVAYNNLAGLVMTQDLTGLDLGSMTLTSGVYRFSTSAQLTGGLSLDAQNDPDAYFVFQIGSTLTTADSSAVVLLNAPVGFDSVYWQVGSSATLGIGTAFTGSILADQSITLNGGTMYGRALALNGAVTIAAQETIIVPEPATMALLVFGAGFVVRKAKGIRQKG